jgi:hypothetical protein
MMEVAYVTAKRQLKISPKWRKMSEIYRYFSREWAHLCVYDEQAALDMYCFETFGTPLPAAAKLNGFALGKQWMDVAVAMWKEDLKAGLLFRSELYSDPAFPHWWLDRVLRE